VIRVTPRLKAWAPISMSIYTFLGGKYNAIGPCQSGNDCGTDRLAEDA